MLSGKKHHLSTRVIVGPALKLFLKMIFCNFIKCIKGINILFHLFIYIYIYMSFPILKLCFIVLLNVYSLSVLND